MSARRPFPPASFLPLRLVLAAAAASLLPSCSPAAESPAGKPAPRPRTVMTPKDTDDLKAIQTQAARLIPKLIASTVAVRVGNSQGTGVVVTKDGYVLTAGHVAEKPGLPVTFTFSDGRTYEGITLGEHQGVDAGMMKITDPGSWPPLPMGQSEDLAPGTWCLALGHSQGYQEGRPPIARLGRILFARHSVLQTDCPLVAGDSGGPLVDLDGRLIGINSRMSGLGSMNFHVAIEVFRENWDRLAKGELWQADRPARETPPIVALFKPIVADAARAVVKISSHDQAIALGTIVDPAGWIITKASEMPDDASARIVCETADGRECEARVVDTHAPYDLALLKIDARDLPPPPWAKTPADTPGTWVAVPGGDNGTPLAIGIISTTRRKVPPARGVMGAVIDDSDKGPRVTRVNENGAAQKAGLQENDLITHVNGQRINNEADLWPLLKRTQVGDKMELTVRRGHRRLTLTATLGAAEPPAGPKKKKWIASAAVGVSDRRDDFPVILPHDSIVAPAECGSPLVDLHGQVIGLNIARAGRNETYAIPTDVLLPIVHELIACNSTPPSKKNGRRANGH